MPLPKNELLSGINPFGFVLTLAIVSFFAAYYGSLKPLAFAARRKIA